MGGANALDLAILHPERVTGLALIGTALHGAPEAETYEEPIASVIAKAEAAYEAADWAELNRLEAWIWLDGAGVPEGRVSGPARDLFLDMNGRVLAADDPGEPAPTLDARARVGEIAAPTLILVGRLDLPEIIATDAELAERIPSAQLEWLADTAHLPHLEGHEVCLQKVSDFVDAVAEGRVSQGG
jgi:pimeloyl-ACP methyl ester carboxylesterase